LILIISSGFLFQSFAQFPVPTDNKQAIKENQESTIIVLDAVSLKKSRAHHSAAFDDFIEVKLNTFDFLFNPEDSSFVTPADSTIFLCINGMPCFDIPAYSFDRRRNSIVFQLKRNTGTLIKLAKLFQYPWSKIKLSTISVNIAGNPPLPTKVNDFILFFTSPFMDLYSLILVVIIFGSFFFLIKYTNIIRVGNEKSSYSLAMSQLAFWTLLISASVIYIWLTTNNLPELTPSTLALLGISIATTAGSKVYQQNLKLWHKKNISLNLKENHNFMNL
jgi:hypothetical protein